MEENNETGKREKEKKQRIMENKRKKNGNFSYFFAKYHQMSTCLFLEMSIYYNEFQREGRGPGTWIEKIKILDI